MVTEESEKIVLIGFNTDYQKLEAEELAKQYNVEHLVMNAFLYFFLNKLKLESLTKYVTKHYYALLTRKLKNYHVIVTDDPIDINAVKAFNRQDVTIIMRNSVLGNKKITSLVSDYSVFSFDFSDCEKFKFKPMNQYIPNVSVVNEFTSVRDECDFFFLGLDKGRKSTLDSLKFKLETLKFKTDFRVKYSPKGMLEKVDKWIKRNDKYKMLSYRDNLYLAARSSCIVELVQEGQSGITLRALESIFLGKKLLTNNKDILKSSLFKKNNIMYFENSDSISNEELIAFIKKPFDEYPQQTLEEYTFSYNVKTILGID